MDAAVRALLARSPSPELRGCHLLDCRRLYRLEGNANLQVLARGVIRRHVRGGPEEL